MSNPIVKFKKGTGYILGVPARDLTPAEWDKLSLDQKKKCVETGLYKPSKVLLNALSKELAALEPEPEALEESGEEETPPEDGEEEPDMSQIP